MKPSEMTDDQLRVKIAEIRGEIDADSASTYTHFPWMVRINMDACSIPDYPRDLNACHEMEESSIIFKSWRDTERWLDALEIAVIGRKAESRPDLSFVFRATARQRCEAFVEVMSK